MKSKPNIRSQFGLTNEEMAMALGVSLSVWSMYELGLRGLSSRASLLLAEMLKHAQEFKLAAREEIHPELIEHQQKYLESKLHENEFRQSNVTWKITAAVTKLEIAERKRHIASFLTARAAGKTNHEPGVSRLIAEKADKVLAVDNRLLLLDLEIKRETLISENRVLQSKLRELLQSGKKSE